MSDKALTLCFQCLTKLLGTCRESHLTNQMDMLGLYYVGRVGASVMFENILPIKSPYLG